MKTNFDENELTSMIVLLNRTCKKNVSNAVEIRKLMNEIKMKLNNVNDKKVVIICIMMLTKIKNSIMLNDKLQSVLESEFSCFNDEIDTLESSSNISNNEAMLLHRKNRNNAYIVSKNKRSNFPKHILRILKSWLKNHIESPYPTEMEKIALSEATGLDQTQINNWFINARRRLLPDLKNKK